MQPDHRDDELRARRSAHDHRQHATGAEYVSDLGLVALRDDCREELGW
ncbi:hypothetical protein [Nocardia gamkensis]